LQKTLTEPSLLGILTALVPLFLDELNGISKT